MLENHAKKYIRGVEMGQKFCSIHQEIQKKLEEQREYFHTQETLSFSFRKEQLRKLQAAIVKYEAQILVALEADLGKPTFEGYVTEVGYVYNSIRAAQKNLKKWTRPKKVTTPIVLQPAKSKIVYEPYGQVLIIGPYNYPFQLIMEPLIGAIAAGNCITVKPSEISSYTEKVIVTLLQETFDEKYIWALSGDVEVHIALLEQRFDYIFFTGSTEVGKKVMTAAAQHLTPVTLELGGKSPVFVDRTANLSLAAKRIIWGKMLNAGQTCVAPDYIYVEKCVQEPLLDALKKSIRDLYGTDIQRNKDFCRIVNERHFTRLKNLLPSHSSYIAFGGTIDETEKYIEPTLLHVQTWDEAIMKEEIFGPILPILTYENLDEAIEQVRKQPKPLALYVFSTDSNITNQIIQSISSGGVCINDTISHLVNPNLPFGGVGASGMGAYHGKHSFKTFSHARSILQRSNRVQIDLAYPPYTKAKWDWIRKIFRK